MKQFYKWLGLMLVILSSFGFVLPTLLSSDDYILFSCGILYILGLPYILYKFFAWVIK